LDLTKETRAGTLKGLRSSSTILYLGSREVPKALRRGANLGCYARPPACAAPDNTPLWLYETGAPVRSVSVSSDGSHVTAGSDEHPRGPLERSHRDLFSIRDGVVSVWRKDLNPRGGLARGLGPLETGDWPPDSWARAWMPRASRLGNWARQAELVFNHMREFYSAVTFSSRL